jgi:putative ABC transport system permease protein
VVGALGAAWLLRERGIAAQAGGGPDLLVAAVLALVGIAAGVVAMRIYPVPARLVGWLIAQRRDLLPVLAVRRAIRGGSSAAVVLLLVASASVGTFASATLVQLEDGARAAAWNEIGAEFRISSSTGVLPAELEPLSLPGVEAAAEASLRAIATDHGTAWLLSYDAARLADVVAGTPAAVDLPPLEPPTGGPDRLPAVVGGLTLAVGDTFAATISQRTIGLVVSEIRPTFPGVPPGEAYVAVAAQLLDGALQAGAPRASMLLVRATPAAVTELRTAIGALGSWLVLDSRAENAAARLGAPVMNALRALIAALAVLALAYAAIAVGAALMLAVAAQREETAHLRALGVARSGRGWLALFEYGPAALAGYLIGAGLGLALFAFILPALGLASIIGSTVELSVGIQPIHLLALLGAILFILVIGWLGGVVAQRDTDPVTAIRRGIE